jgi:hypothetical protein
MAALGTSLEVDIPVEHLWDQQLKLVKGKCLKKTGQSGTLSPTCYPTKLPGRKYRGGVTDLSVPWGKAFGEPHQFLLSR